MSAPISFHLYFTLAAFKSSKHVTHDVVETTYGHLQVELSSSYESGTQAWLHMFGGMILGVTPSRHSTAHVQHSSLIAALSRRALEVWPECAAKLQLSS